MVRRWLLWTWWVRRWDGGCGGSDGGMERTPDAHLSVVYAGIAIREINGPVSVCVHRSYCLSAC